MNKDLERMSAVLERLLEEAHQEHLRDPEATKARERTARTNRRKTR